MPLKAYWASVRIGGTTGARDKIDGADLADKDPLLLFESTDTARFYWLDDDASGSEGEGVTNPDTNPGTKSWLLLGITIPNTGLHILDTDASDDLIIKPGSDLSADRTLTLTTGDASRTITLSGNPTLADWFDQAVKTSSDVVFVKITSTGGRVRNTTRKINTDSPYTVLATDEILFFDTDGGAIEADLPAGVEGTHYKLINCGSSGNDLTVDPNGSEQVYGSGAGVVAVVADGEVIDIEYNATEGWW